MSSRITTTPLAPTVGVEITGLDLREPITDGEADELRDLMWQHSVLVFRDQDTEPDDQIRLVGQFGTVADELGTGATHTFVSNVVDGAMLGDGDLLFHADLTYTPAPYLVICLAAIELRGAVSATRFASLAGGWAALPDDLRARVADLTNTHVHWHLDGDDYVKTDLAATPDGAEYRVDRAVPPADVAGSACAPHDRCAATVRQPVVQPHRRLHRGGERRAAGGAVRLPVRPANVYEHEWRPGDVVAWDNLAVQHSRKPFRGGDAVRTLRRVIATGDGRGMAATYQLAGAAMPGAHAYGR